MYKDGERKRWKLLCFASLAWRSFSSALYEIASGTIRERDFSQCALSEEREAQSRLDMWKSV